MKQNYKEAAKDLWSTNPAGWTHASTMETGSKEFFDTVLHNRFIQECPWMEGLVNFEQYKNKKVLEIGCGAGYDAFKFCQAGTQYTGIDIVPDNIVLTKKHLSYYGYTPRILEMDAEQLMFENEQFDFIFSFGVIHHIPDVDAVLQNTRKLLAPGGKAQFIVYYKHSIFYWGLYFYKWLWLQEYKNYSSFEERLGKIENVGSTEKDTPLVRVYSKRDFKKLFEKHNFTVLKMSIYKLHEFDLPNMKWAPFYKKLPVFLKKWLEKNFGWYLSITVSV